MTKFHTKKALNSFYNYFFFSAMAGSDYISVVSARVFPSGSTDGATECVNITILDDTEFEGLLIADRETFHGGISTSDPNVLIEANATEIFIQDNDGG